MRSSLARKVLAVLCYGSSSALLVFTNKVLLSSYGIHPATLLLSHLVSVLMLAVLLWAVDLVALSPDILTLKSPVVWKILPLTVFFTLDVIVGMAALRFVNIPMFTALRRVSILMVLVLEYVVLKMVPSRTVVFAVAVACVGLLLAALGDLRFEPLGYLFAAVADVTTATHRVLIKKLHLQKVAVFTMMYVNAALALPLLVAVNVVRWKWGTPSGSDADAGYSPADSSLALWWCTSCFLAFFMTYAMFMCTAVTSPLTTSITGQVKNQIVLVGGFFAFGGVPFHPLNIAGHALCSLGSLLYFRAMLLGSASQPAAGVGGRQRVPKHADDSADVV